MQKSDIDIIYKDVKHSSLKVKPNKEITLTVPLCLTDKEIEYILKKRSIWINKQLELFKHIEHQKKELVSGENFVYLGKNYRIKVIKSDIEKAKLSRGYFELYVNDKNDYSKKEKLINEWYKSRAKEYFKKIIEKYAPIVNINIQTVRIRAMKTRWGSCNPNKSYINLNLELIKKPKIAIEYVVFHELAHLLHHGHDKKFYNYMSLHMPDWKRRKIILNLHS